MLLACEQALVFGFARERQINPQVKGLITWAGLARFAEISARLDLLNATKINFAITWQPGQPG